MRCIPGRAGQSFTASEPVAASDYRPPGAAPKTRGASAHGFALGRLLTMLSHTRIALLGFGEVERAAFDAFFNIAGRRCPPYVHETDYRAADFLVVDGTHAAACATVRAAGLLGRTVMLGGTQRKEALVHLRRPLNLMQVGRALDQVLEHDLPASTVPQGGEHDIVVVEEGGPGPPLAGPLLRRRPVRRLDHILVVDDSDVALRFMATHLQRFGFQVHLARSGEEALERVATRHFEFVFLDVLMAGLDGLQTCKAIKRGRYAEGVQPPTVVMISCLGTPADRLRGTMAGADAYLTKPLREVELLRVVGEREVTRHAFVDTAQVSTLR
jgi:CheY-like chemotaxis protein